MGMVRVRNSVAETPRVTLFGHLPGGRFVAEVMDEDQVPYVKYWDDAIDQVMVYIEPDDAQLEVLLKALHEGRLDYHHLQDYGGTRGGMSEIPIQGA